MIHSESCNSLISKHTKPIEDFLKSGLIEEFQTKQKLFAISKALICISVALLLKVVILVVSERNTSAA